MDKIFNVLGDNILLLATLAISVVVLSFAHWFWIKRNPDIGAEKKLPRQIWLFLLTVLALLSIVLTLPIEDSTRQQILNLVGIVLTGVIAFSSTTFVANIMAGLMLRVVNAFAPGDYIKFNDQLCRVTERGLFHTEVQNEDKDLITCPNLYLITNPTSVISHNGTVITCSLSLGYDVSRLKVEEELIKAAESIGLETPFVTIKSLGDFSITYKVTGFLTEVRGLVIWRSNLHKAVLDHLHNANIEIVSPTFMNTRQYSTADSFIAKNRKKAASQHHNESVEEKIFSKAEIADEVKILNQELEELETELKLAKKNADNDKAIEITSLIELVKAKRDEITIENP